MAAVLFIVTVPTENEEKRLKNEYIARKLNFSVDYTDATKNSVYPADQTTANTIPISEESKDVVNNDNNNGKMFEPSTPLTTIPVININGNQMGENNMRGRKSEANCDELLIDSALGGVEAIAESRMPATMKATSTKGVKEKDVHEGTMDVPPIMRKSWEGIREKLSSSKRKFLNKKETEFDLDMPYDTCMEIVLREILNKYQIINAVWTKDSKGSIYQVIFTIDFDKTYENVLDKFNEWGIGERDGSTVSVMSCIIAKTFERKNEFDLNGDISKENINDAKQGVWERFMNTVHSRLNVEQIVRDVRQDASISFDFIILLISAAICASFGLAENSLIFLASSMLISPLMGPIIAGIFGTVIRDHSLRTLGLKNELIGLLMATLVGFLFGIVVCIVDARYSIGEGLTFEMLSRCELRSVLIGICIAIPSGAAVAIAILGGNIGSLVGVAISASLLPPAVNSGMLWALACVYTFFGNDNTRFNEVIKSQVYSKHQGTELAIMGVISMCITITNILCIYVMGILVLKVKEIAPVISRNNRQFWKHDIKIARDLNKSGLNTDTVIIDEIANLPKEDQKVLGINCDFLRNMQLDDDAMYQNTWSPIGGRHHYDPMPENYSTIHQIGRIYSTITRQQALNQQRYRFSLTRCPAGCMSDVGTSYKILTEKVGKAKKLPRGASITSNSIRSTPNNVTTDGTSESVFEPTTSNITLISSTSTSTSEEKRRRKFIVTPAVDPLLYPDEVDI